jgi:hypothetical protein
MELDIPELKAIDEKLTKLLSQETDPSRAWYTLAQAWDLKGGCAWETFRQNRWIQPLGGLYEGYIGGKACFRRETILEWLPLADEMLPAYHEKHLTGARVPAVKKARKAS